MNYQHFFGGLQLEEIDTVEAITRLREDPPILMADTEKQALEQRLRNVEAKLRESEARYQELVENADDVICTADLEGNFRSVNHAAEFVSGHSRSELIGRPFSDFVAPEFRPLLGKMTGLKLAGQHSTVFEVEVMTKDGHRIPMELNTRLKFVDGKPVGIQGIGRDLSDSRRMSNELRRRNEALEEANATIRRLMNQDSLTKLANRRALEETLERAISFARRTAQSMCLILCDIDHFKVVNDTYGHATGDEVLSTFAKLLVKSCRREDTAARFGGEEFVLLLPNTRLDGGVEIAERIRQNMDQIGLEGGTTLTASFGVAECRIDDTSETLIARADQALYSAKESGRDKVMSRE